jgi:DNA-binding CsgD family transcriptional regulator
MPASSVREHRFCVSDVLQALVGLAEERQPDVDISADVDPSAEQIILDAEFNGYRYLVVKMPLPLGNGIHLSPRELEIARMVAKGHPNKVIADVLNISSWTVCTHMRRIFAKVGVCSRASMVARLLEIGSLSDELRMCPHRRLDSGPVDKRRQNGITGNFLGAKRQLSSLTSAKAQDRS